MMNILIIGGTRNMGYYLAERVLKAGHRLTLLNRGISRDDLPDDVPRLRCDRTDSIQMRRALAGRQFDVVIDMVLYKGREAEDIVDILAGQTKHYIFISTGQIYLVRDGVQRPFREADYDGKLIPTPEPNTYDYEEWLYGSEKRQAEDVLRQAFNERGFPYTSVRIPMVNSARDPFNRLYGYILRIKDGGPILVPETPDYPLRHIYALDVVEAVMKLIERGPTSTRAYNISQDETLKLEDFLQILGDVVGMAPNTLRVSRDLLMANGFLPDCSPFSDLWMSELDNTLSKTELGMHYTPVRTYLQEIVEAYQANPPSLPAGYKRRNAEKHLLPQGQ
ncbi:MAG: NAD-dependent epimerase/dehydratase family protein [bacterium]|nr:NAD-dependent epimerase/dehydratase family protein [bacterium]